MNSGITESQINQVVSNVLNERSIEEYKIFYKTHLLNIKSRESVLEELNIICTQFRKTPPKTVLQSDPKRYSLEAQTESFLKKNFGSKVLKLYNKEIPKTVKNNYNLPDESFWLALLGAFAKTFEELSDQYKREWSYKTNFLNFLYQCFYSYGLHPNILKRNSITDKFFNLTLYHHFKSKSKKVDFKIMMDYEQFDNEFVSLYMEQLPIKIGGKLIPFNDIYEVRITTTLLKEDEIELFALKNDFVWDQERKDVKAFVESCKDETEKYHPNPFDKRTHQKGVNIFLVEETKQWLVAYPGAFKLFKGAMEKFDKQLYERNMLDDLRLSLEILLKELFNNRKSLENQVGEIGAYQQVRGATSEVTNMFHKLLNYYSKYQNSYVKHNDNVPSDEIEFVIDLTATFMKYLIKK